MHEFTLALEVVSIVENAAIQNKANSVSKVKLDVGTQSGVVIDALEFALDSAIKNTILEKSGIEINVIDSIAKCDDCSNEFIIDNIFDPCPKCSSFNNKLLKGREFKVSSIVIEN